MRIPYNYTLISAVASWFAAQFIKTIIHAIKYKTFNPERLFGAGGMPSSHSALVCAATLACGRIEGIESVPFAIMFLVAMVVMYDAMGVRRSAGLHAREINKLRDILMERNEINEKTKKLKEYIGHTPLEVLGGAMLGILIALIMPVTIG
ncbi:MAG: divergent PAP2 family protein [Oscillospiraceae bacterium]